MKTRYRLIRRGNRSGALYCVDTKTGKRTSLATTKEDEAIQIIQARNEAEPQPVINLKIARAYLMASDPGITSRTWQVVMEEITKTKTCLCQRCVPRRLPDRTGRLRLFKVKLPSRFPVGCGSKSRLVASATATL